MEERSEEGKDMQVFINIHVQTPHAHNQREAGDRSLFVLQTHRPYHLTGGAREGKGREDGDVSLH